MIGLLYGLVALSAVLFVVATVLPLWRTPSWWVRVFDFPRVQITVGALVALVLLVGMTMARGDAPSWAWGLIVALGTSVIWQTGRMWPYTPWAARQSLDASADVPAAKRLRLVVTNVLMTNRDHARWATVIRKAAPDVILAVETDAAWADYITEEFGATHPHQVMEPQDNTYGMVVVSRFPLRNTEVRRLVEPTVPSLFTQIELPSGDLVQGVFLHPRPPRPELGLGTHLRDAELVLAARAVQKLPAPTVVAGDLNDVAWSRTTRLFQNLSEVLDPRVGRGLFSTFHADWRLLRYPLDHVFHSDGLTVAEIRRLDHVGSDHFPVLIELAVERKGRRGRRRPTAHVEHRDDAQEAIDEARERLTNETEADRRERDRKDR